MSYAIYSFVGMIIRVQNISEANRLLWIATDTNGLIVVKAQALREEKSKLRYVTQLFDCARIEVISGKDGWKLVGAESCIDTALRDAIYDNRVAIASIAQTIVQVSLEELSDEPLELYSIMMRAVSAMQQYSSALVVMAARAALLADLGYVEKLDYLSDDYLAAIVSDPMRQKELQLMLERGLFDSHM